jgi:hypothetical protein
MLSGIGWGGVGGVGGVGGTTNYCVTPTTVELN